MTALSPRGSDLSGTFGRYHIVRKLGQGGMGAVYLAFDPSLARRVALKVPLMRGPDDTEVLARFQQAVRAVASLRHPAICPIHEAGTIDGLPYLTMEYVEGQTLAECLRAGMRFSPSQAAALVRRLAEALAVAHEQGVIHRDVKPSNVLVDTRGEPVLMDFGLARRLTQDTRLTRSRAALGTPAYMAPEQVRGDPTAQGVRADVYSLGVVLYELLTDRLPFEGANEAVIFARILSDELPLPPTHYRPGLAPELESVCLKAMARSPEERFDSMLAFAAALAPACSVPGPAPVGMAQAQEGSVWPPDESWSLPLSLDGQGLPPLAPEPPLHLTPEGAMVAPETRPSSAWQPYPPATAGNPWAWRLVAAAVAGLSLLGFAVLGYFQFRHLGQEAEHTPAPPSPPAPVVEHRPAPDPRPAPAPRESVADRLWQQGIVALEKKDYARALEHFEGVARREPKRAAAYYYRGRLRAHRREDEQALLDFNQALKLDPDSAESYLARAQVHGRRKDLEQAIHDATEALRRQPRLPQAYVTRGYAHYLLGREDEAQADYADALRLFGAVPVLTAPAFPEDYLERTRFHLHVDRYGQAIADALAARKLDPDGVEAYRWQAAAYHNQGSRVMEVATATEALRDCRPRTAAGHVDLARFALDLGKPDEAIRACNRATDLDAQLPDACDVRAEAYRRKGDRGRCLADKAEAARLLKPRCARDYLRRSELYQGAERYERALADAEQALRLAPGLSAAYQRRATVSQAMRGAPAAAAGDFKKALALLIPKYAEGYYHQAWLYNELSQYEKALASGKRALALGLQSSAVHVELGYACRDLLRYGAAEHHFDEALRLAPFSAALYKYRGQMRQRQRDYGKAIQDYSAALAINPHDPALFKARGDAHSERDTRADLQRALADYGRALELTPESAHPKLATLYNNRGLIWFRLGRYGDAVADFTRAIEHRPTQAVFYSNRADAYRRSNQSDLADADKRKAKELRKALP